MPGWFLHQLLLLRATLATADRNHGGVYAWDNEAGEMRLVDVPGLPAIRPPVERYLRCTVTFGSWTIEPGLQYDRGERLAPLLSQLQLAIGEAWKAAAPVSIDDVPKLNERVEQLVTRLWPDRAWFLEVHHTTAGWTQIYQPYGIPRTIR